jgi:hypothetical protein
MLGAMFFSPRKRRKPSGRVSHPSDPATSQFVEPEFVRWHTWRCAAQKTTRAWNEWLAAGGRELYHCYVCALAEEEQAAVEIERGVGLEANAQHALDRVSKSGPSASRTPPRSIGWR